MSTWNRALAIAHLEELAARHDIQLLWLTGREGVDWKYACAFHKSRTVHVPVPRNPRLYLVALHEFGHLLSPTAKRLWGASERPDVSTACEGAAWGWAMGALHRDLAGKILRADLSHVEFGIIYHSQQLVRETRERAGRL